nr:helitron helicase-like domain-containing protein [Tanacetum cinerariifolium]
MEEVKERARTKRKLVPKSVGVSSNVAPVERNIVGHDDGDPSVPFDGPCIRPSSSTPCVGQESHVRLTISPSGHRIGRLKRNVFDQDGGHSVCGVGPSIPSNRSCIRQSCSTPYDDGHNVCGVGHSVPLKRPCGRQSNSIRCVGQQLHEGLSMAGERPTVRLDDKALHYTLVEVSVLAGILYVNSYKFQVHHPTISTYEVVVIVVNIVEPCSDRHFLENIKAYNHMFSMTSLGAQIDESINNGRGPYVFKISGQLYHWIGSLCLAEGPIVYETGPETDMDYDIILEGRLGYPQRANKLHLSYMSLQFPLLFIYSQDGYPKELKMINVIIVLSEKN